MPVKGATAVKSYLKKISADIEGPKTVQALNHVLDTGIASAVYYAPVEYSTLVNSRRKEVVQTSSGWRGIAGFYVDYASYLEYNTNWSPRPPDKKEGPDWNPSARPGFLKYGFENEQSKRLIDSGVEAIYKGGL